MTRDETINILMSIQAAYPSFKVPDKTAIKRRNSDEK